MDRCVQEHWLEIFILVLAFLVGGMAIWQRVKGQKTPPPDWKSWRSELWLSLWRAFFSVLAFLAFALLTNPALTCIFRDHSCKSEIKTYIPDWAQSFGLGVVAAGLSAIAAKWPGLVTES